VSSTDRTPPGGEADLVLRPASGEDAERAATLFTSSRAAAGDLFPPAVHSAGEDRAFVARRIATSEVWVAERPDGLVGYLDLEEEAVHSLYVDPTAQRRGVGTALLDLAKARRPHGFHLWVFVTNTPARSLYLSRGLVELETTDGSGNEEKAPDVRMAWPGSDPLAYFRGRIDAVDAEIATLVARRVALTAAIQEHKDRRGHEGRDPEREQQIARRMAQRAPDLEVADLTRVVHTLVEVGLDVAERGRQ
jgi:chorismate mutase/ribosomal protein S18 acetylase RimI-like enzyme